MKSTVRGVRLIRKRITPFPLEGLSKVFFSDHLVIPAPHIIYSDYATTGDGIMSALMLLSMMRDKGEPLSKLADCMEVYPQVLLGLDVTEKPPTEEVVKGRVCLYQTGL